MSEETRKKVLALVGELNYRPNALAQGLRTRKTYQIACIVLSIDNPFYGQVMLGVEEVANRCGYVLTMYSASVMEQNWGASFFTGRHDGIILLSINHDRVLKQLRGVRVPIIAYSDSGPHTELPYISVNLEEAEKDVIEHLIGLGHTHIGYLGTRDAHDEKSPRIDGFIKGMHANGIQVEDQHIQFIPGYGTMESGYTGMAELYRKFPLITAVVTMNDLIGFGAMRWMQDNGIRIPEDISVVGCDDITYSAMSNPPLSTIQIPKREIGNRLMEALLNAMGDGQVRTNIQLPTRLIMRASATNVRKIG